MEDPPDKPCKVLAGSERGRSPGRRPPPLFSFTSQPRSQLVSLNLPFLWPRTLPRIFTAFRIWCRCYLLRGAIPDRLETAISPTLLSVPLSYSPSPPTIERITFRCVLYSILFLVSSSRMLAPTKTRSFACLGAQYLQGPPHPPQAGSMGLRQVGTTSAPLPLPTQVPGAIMICHDLPGCGPPDGRGMGA